MSPKGFQQYSQVVQGVSEALQGISEDPTAFQECSRWYQLQNIETLLIPFFTREF